LSLADLVKRLSDYEVVVPRKVSEQGQLLSHHLTHHYDDASRRQRRRRRQVDDNDDDDDDQVHYRLELSGREKQLHLKPNDRLLASSFIVERRQGRNVTNHRLTTARHQQCHYMGRVKGHPESTVAVSTCNGLVSRLYFIYFIDGQTFHPNGSYAIVYTSSLATCANPIPTASVMDFPIVFLVFFISFFFVVGEIDFCRRTLKSNSFWGGIK
jgi:hypothetical protein